MTIGAVHHGADVTAAPPVRRVDDRPLTDHQPGAVDAATPSLRRAASVGAALGLIPFVVVLWDFGLDPLRRGTAAGTNADFFDLQARALFHGHLDVPPGSLGIEAFVVGGRHYLYFPPFPALLRMPLLALTDRLDGRLTAPSMLLAALVLACALVRLAVARARGSSAAARRWGASKRSRSAPWSRSVLGGSTLVYLASEPWVYHEVYVWSAAWSVATLAGLVTRVDRPAAPAWS